MLTKAGSPHAYTLRSKCNNCSALCLSWSTAWVVCGGFLRCQVWHKSTETVSEIIAPDKQSLSTPVSPSWWKSRLCGLLVQSLQIKQAQITIEITSSTEIVLYMMSSPVSLENSDYTGWISFESLPVVLKSEQPSLGSSPWIKKQRERFKKKQKKTRKLNEPLKLSLWTTSVPPPWLQIIGQ